VGHNLIRNNRIADCGWDNVLIGDEYNVFEYNEISGAKNTGGDVFKWPGNNLIIRGNYIHDVSDFGGSHVDIMQFSSCQNVFFIGNRIARTNNQIFFGGPAINMLYRNNLLESIQTNYALYFSGTGMRVMNNTLDIISCYQAGALGDSTTAILKNNIIYNIGSSNHYSYGGGTATTIADDYNYVYQWGLNRPHDISGGDPGFVNYANHDYHLQSTSRCKDAGCFLTTTTSAGSGTQLPVADPYMFCDGWGLADGDSIQLAGQTQTAKITSLNYSTKVLTLNRSLTWTNGQGVALPYNGTAPDMGAYEYYPANTISLTSGSDAKNIVLPGNLSAANPIIFDLKRFADTKVFSLIIYDSQGAMVKSYNRLPAGGTITWDSADLPSGIYFYAIRINEIGSTGKLVICD
jgi:hypothetical protein